MAKKQTNRGGRPTNYTEELGIKICEIIATHAIGLGKLEKMYDFFPHKQILFGWMFKNQRFYDQYLEARKLQSHVIADEALDMAENIPTYFDDKGIERIDQGFLGRARFNFECRKWHASKLEPKTFGNNYRLNMDDKESIHQENMARKQELDEKNKKDF